MKEVWKQIENYPDYEVSNLGRVKSLKNGREKILKNRLNNNGYYHVTLFNNNRYADKGVHQIVAIAFLNHIPRGYKFVVNHKDLNKLNNCVDNLEVVTARENCNKKHLKTTSKYTGVSWDKSRCKWVSAIQINNKNIHLGRFNNEIDASIAYQNKVKEIEITCSLILS